MEELRHHRGQVASTGAESGAARAPRLRASRVAYSRPARWSCLVFPLACPGTIGKALRDHHRRERSVNVPTAITIWLIVPPAGPNRRNRTHCPMLCSTSCPLTLVESIARPRRLRRSGVDRQSQRRHRPLVRHRLEGRAHPTTRHWNSPIRTVFGGSTPGCGTAATFAASGSPPRARYSTCGNPPGT